MSYYFHYYRFQLLATNRLLLFSAFQLLVQFYILYEVIDVNDIGPNFVEWCADQTATRLLALAPGAIGVDGGPDCDDIATSENMTDIDRDYVCPRGHVFRAGHCCE